MADSKDPHKEKIISSEWIYKGKIISVRIDQLQFPGISKPLTREYVAHQEAVGIVAVNHENHLILVTQYRHAASQPLIEIPAGLIEDREDPISCAKRELQEEIGYEANHFTPLGSYYTSPGFCNERVHLFVAKDLKKKSLPPDPEEDIRSLVLREDIVLKMIQDRTIQDMKTITALLLYFQYRGLL